MQLALDLAKKGLSWTNPHPLVGAVIVKAGRIIARGYHHRFGENHAEADAIAHMADPAELRGATMYVTLEPCHLPYDLHGARIPCGQYILNAGISQVHIAMLDSNPEVLGQGRAMLEAAGVPTTLGCLGEAALALNAAYHHFMTYHQPLVVRAPAVTNGELRKTCQAILIDAATFLRDEPDLSCHDAQYQDPLRLILDPEALIPATAQLRSEKRTMVLTPASSQELLATLVELKIISVLVEGANPILEHFLSSFPLN